MSAKGSYSQFYSWKRLCLQVILQGQREGLCIDLLPQLTLAINNRRVVVGLGFQWIAGNVNIGYMTKGFMDSEKGRIETVRKLADKARISVKQQALRWGW